MTRVAVAPAAASARAGPRSSRRQGAGAGHRAPPLPGELSPRFTPFLQSPTRHVSSTARGVSPIPAPSTSVTTAGGHSQLQQVELRSPLSPVFAEDEIWLQGGGSPQPTAKPESLGLRRE